MKMGELQRIRDKLATTDGRTVAFNLDHDNRLTIASTRRERWPGIQLRPLRRVAEVEMIAEAVQALDGRGMRANPLKVGDLPKTESMLNKLGNCHDI